MTELTLVLRQAQTLAEKVSAFNAARLALGEYFGAICDANDLSRDTEFVSVSPETGVLVVKVPDDG